MSISPSPPFVGGTCRHAATFHPSSCHSPPRHGQKLLFILLTDINVFIFCATPAPPPPLAPSVLLVSRLLLPSPSPSSLCILDHFLSFQVSGPVEADDPSPGGAGPPHCLRSVSLSLCSRYAHSPHPVCVGGWGRGAGRSQARRWWHLLQQQTLMMLLVPFTLSTHSNTHGRQNQHTPVQHTTQHTAAQAANPTHDLYTES